MVRVLVKKSTRQLFSKHRENTSREAQMVKKNIIPI